MRLDLATKLPSDNGRLARPPFDETNVQEQPVSVPKLKEALERVERQLVIEALTQTKGNQAGAARALGITDRIMGLRVRKYGLDPRDFRMTVDRSTRWL